MAMLELEPTTTITGAGFFTASLPDLLEAVLSDRFLCVDGLWCIDNLDAMLVPPNLRANVPQPSARQIFS